MKTISLITRLTILSLALFVSTAASIASPRLVFVHNVEELYAAVNDPANVDTKLVLSPGIYLLSVNDPNNVPRPNLGRLELQEDMSLIGVEGERGAVVIDAANLPATSYQGGTIPLGAMRVGRGRNSIEWLTVRNTLFGFGNIVSGLAYDGTPHIRIAHIASTGGTYGLNIFNFGAGFAGKVLELDMIDNDLYENRRGIIQAGFRIGNFDGASGSVINVRMNGNRIWGNQQSFFLNRGTTAPTTNATVNVFSAGNRFFDNGAGLLIFGSLNASGNTVNFDSYGDRFVNNDADTTFDKGGLAIVGGEKFNSPLENLSNNNTVNVSLWGCRLSGNGSYDLATIGARSTQPAVGNPGENNRVTVTLHGIGRQPFVELFANVIPANPATTNTVTVIR